MKMGHEFFFLMPITTVQDMHVIECQRALEFKNDGTCIVMMIIKLFLNDHVRVSSRSTEKRTTRIILRFLNVSELFQPLPVLRTSFFHKSQRRCLSDAKAKCKIRVL